MFWHILPENSTFTHFNLENSDAVWNHPTQKKIAHPLPFTNFRTMWWTFQKNIQNLPWWPRCRWVASGSPGPAGWWTVARTHRRRYFPVRTSSWDWLWFTSFFLSSHSLPRGTMLVSFSSVKDSQWHKQPIIRFSFRSSKEKSNGNLPHRECLSHSLVLVMNGRMFSRLRPGVWQ